MFRHTVTFALAFAAAGCGGSTQGTPSEVTPEQALRIATPQTGGAAADGLAAALLASTPMQGYRPDRPVFEMQDLDLRRQIEGLARTHLAQQNGASVQGSAFIRRLAQEPGAPADANGDGSNLDETLQRQLAAFGDLTGGAVDPSQPLSLFHWRDGLADFADAQRTSQQQTAVGEISLEQAGRTMLARTLLATALLQRSRGSRPGATAEEGLAGLRMMQQVIAMEETIFSNLFTAGATLGNLSFPSDYDPQQAPVRWVPSVVAATGGDVTESYKLVDPASSLATIASVMRAGAELAFYAGEANPNPRLRDIFRGHPFGEKPGGGIGGGPAADERELVTWENGISQLFTLWCSGCHEQGNFPGGNFVLDSYATVQRGGDRSGPITSSVPGGGKPPIIVRGDPDNSVLYTILTETFPKGFERMPQLGPYMGPPELALVRQWILDGARSAPPGPPDIGVDLAIVMFKNLVALHLDEKTGALYVRNDGDAAPIQLVDVATTGEVLQALAALAHLAPVLEVEGYDFTGIFTKVATFALEELSTDLGAVATTYDLAAEGNRAAFTGDLVAHARLTAGLLAAARVLRLTSLETRANLLAQQLRDQFFDPATGFFRSQLGRPGRSFTPLALAAVVDALRESAAAGSAEAVATHAVFLARLLPVLVYSETEATGEVLGDGIADTDGDGIKEPGEAGGAYGRAPVFVGLIQEGPDPAPEFGPILWTKHIRPIFEAACSQCHLQGANRGGYRLDTPTRLRQPGDENPDMSLVIPGDPEGSYLYRKLVDRPPASGAQMPLDLPPLAPHARALVRQWILEGATSR